MIKIGLVAATAVLLVVSATAQANEKGSPAGQNQNAQGAVSTTDAMPVIPGVAEIKGPNRGETRIAREVRHELLMLPYYSLFDDLRYRVDGSTVELLGDVVNPTLKGDAENVVKRIEGVEKVVNHINILPPSPQDERIRQQAARAIFSYDGLSRYGWEAAPSIHIIVKGGRITLAGVVDNESDKNMAGIQARSVPGAFGVQNDLLVAKQK